jgi:cell division septum initiation protein DivIVA
VVSKIELLQLEREVNDLSGELESSRLAVPRIEAALDEAERRVEERRLNFRAEAQRELNAVQAEATALAEAVTAAADQVKRTAVRSPVRGTIKRLLVTSRMRMLLSLTAHVASNCLRSKSDSTCAPPSSTSSVRGSWRAVAGAAETIAATVIAARTRLTFVMFASRC